MFRCNGNQRCFLRANNNVFVNPCFGTYKLLTVNYQCMPAVFDLSDDACPITTVATGSGALCYRKSRSDVQVQNISAGCT